MTFIPIKRVVQLEAYCGPATLEMLLSQYNLDVDQTIIAQKGGVANSIEDFGMRIDQLALATRNISPNLRMLAKRDATFEDLDRLVNKEGLAVGVEWQTIYDDGEFDDDPGHYSVIIGVDPVLRTIILRDPSYMYEDHDRVFSYDVFEPRWFDTNEVGENAPDEAKAWMDDYHVLFVVAEKDRQFPDDLKLKRVPVPTLL